MNSVEIVRDIGRKLQERARGVYLLFEGVDGAGKSTLASNVHMLLHQHKVDTKLRAFPTHTGEIGKLVRRVFSGDAKVSESAMMHLMIADAIDHEYVLSEELEAKNIVIHDRHSIMSAPVYQAEIYEQQHVLEVLQPRRFQQPDIVFLVHVKPEVAMNRVFAKRGAPVNALYEQKDEALFQRYVDRYSAQALMRNLNSAYVVLDGMKQPEELCNTVLRILQDYMTPDEAKVVS